MSEIAGFKDFFNSSCVLAYALMGVMGVQLLGSARDDILNKYCFFGGAGDAFLRYISKITGIDDLYCDFSYVLAYGLMEGLAVCMCFGENF